MTDNETQMTDNETQMTDNETQMTDNETQMTDNETQMTDNETHPVIEISLVKLISLIFGNARRIDERKEDYVGKIAIVNFGGHCYDACYGIDFNNSGWFEHNKFQVFNPEEFVDSKYCFRMSEIKRIARNSYENHVSQLHSDYYCDTPIDEVPVLLDMPELDTELSEYHRSQLYEFEDREYENAMLEIIEHKKEEIDSSELDQTFKIKYTK